MSSLESSGKTAQLARGAGQGGVGGHGRLCWWWWFNQAMRSTSPQSDPSSPPELGGWRLQVSSWRFSPLPGQGGEGAGRRHGPLWEPWGAKTTGGWGHLHLAGGRSWLQHKGAPPGVCSVLRDPVVPLSSPRHTQTALRGNTLSHSRQTLHPAPHWVEFCMPEVCLLGTYLDFK